jgi:hypothetical protein
VSLREEHSASRAFRAAHAGARDEHPAEPAAHPAVARWERVALAAGSIGLGIPITALAATEPPDGGDLFAIAYAWATIGAVNAAHTLAART